MTARFFFSDSTFKQIAEISNWTPGYVVWAFKFWLWIMDKGIMVEVYDVIDYEAWASKGIEGLKKAIPKKEYDFYVKNTKDIESLSSDIKKVLEHPNYQYSKRKPTIDDLRKAFSSGAVCEIVLDSVALDRKEGFGLHRIVVVDIDDKYITFHDPRKDVALPHRKETIEHFKYAWLDKVDAPELCIYKNLNYGK